MHLNRRTLMLASAAGAALAGSTFARSGGALAQDGVAKKEDMARMAAAGPDEQLPGAYRYRIGDFTVTEITDGMAARPLDDSFVVNAGLSDVQAALRQAFLPEDKLFIPFTPLTLRTGEDLILFDTGFGEKGPPTAGQLKRGMAAAGMDPADVTKVVISHFHGDHIMGLTTKDGQPVYPNAEVFVPEPEYAFWMSDENKANPPDGRKGNFDLAQSIFGGLDDRLTQFKWDEEFLPGITAVDARGHTPGHTVFAIESGNERMMFLADTTNHPALFVRHPDWSAVFDQDADQARKTRHRLLDMVSEERMRIASYHFPFPATGHIAKEGEGYRFVPAQWMPVLQGQS
ncbi:MBL fold metallo-hydrolase [Afifella sp. IM 167]|uniref:MBL fold metallo-hydrolase n=1 Tax=Afifella sp. IM 167 TaxID=2033586 RepID=UPI001CC9E326|nr:MBL fold metallo-hydrolase [Afifella sp. IM 167]MBZ8132974.1 MBL fold metallo-hydrolase [Afifella sp. IM 167]